jgi:hypothetical protein
MREQLLQLKISQLHKVLSSFRVNRNKYSDSKKQAYHDKLYELYSKLKKDKLSGLTETEFKRKTEVIRFIFKSVQFLDNSTLNIVPYELIYCLEKALKDWIKEEEFIIVTSLEGDVESYSFEKELALDSKVYTYLKADYDIIFDHKLIQINLPKYFIHDYLANTVLYHELGHFIDLKFKITDRVIDNFILTGQYNEDEDAYKLRVMRNHLREFFADIFEAQYTGKSPFYASNYYSDKSSETHPSTEERIEKLDKFIGGQKDREINLLKSSTKRFTSNELEPKFKEIDSSDFKNLIPVELESDEELHGVFNLGWKLWMDKDNKVKEDLTYQDYYQALNNLMEKSISNYMITERLKNVSYEK